MVEKKEHEGIVENDSIINLTKEIILISSWEMTQP
jgi:hypothetical protein